jgi:hypothetical protein
MFVSHDDACWREQPATGFQLFGELWCVGIVLLTEVSFNCCRCGGCEMAAVGNVGNTVWFY